MNRGRHVQRQAGKELCLRGRHYGRWSGKETSQALEQACIEAGMCTVQRQAERQSSRSNAVVIVPGIDAHMRAKLKKFRPF